MTKCSLIFLLLLIPISPFSAKLHHRHRPLPPPSPPLHQYQLNNIMDTLIGAGDFNNWKKMLSASNLFMFPLTATIFVPSDNSLFPFPFPVPTSSTTIAAFDPLIVPYHIVPQRLTFSELTLFKPFSRLPTLLPSKSIPITNTSLSNFAIDGSQVSHPDLYITSAIAVHGIAELHNYTVYGGEDVLVHGNSPPQPSSPMFQPLGDRRRSDAGCLYGEFGFVLLLIPWVVWGLKIYGNPLDL